MIIRISRRESIDNCQTFTYEVTNLCIIYLYLAEAAGGISDLLTITKVFCVSWRPNFQLLNNFSTLVSFHTFRYLFWFNIAMLIMISTGALRKFFRNNLSYITAYLTLLSCYSKRPETVKKLMKLKIIIILYITGL